MRSKEWGNMREEIADNVRIVGCPNKVAACLHPNQGATYACAHSPLILHNLDTLAAYDKILPLFVRVFTFTKNLTICTFRSTTCWRVLTSCQRNIDRNLTTWSVVILLALSPHVFSAKNQHLLFLHNLPKVKQAMEDEIMCDIVAHSVSKASSVDAITGPAGSSEEK